MITEKDNVFYCDCGFSFQRNRSGAHDCADGLRNKLAESEARCLALAAENAGLKDLARGWANATDDRLFEEHGEIFHDSIEACEEELKTICPTTDAFLAEVRAQGVEMFAAWNDKHIKPGVEHKESLTAVSHAARGFAGLLRKGVQS